MTLADIVGLVYMLTGIAVAWRTMEAGGTGNGAADGFAFPVIMALWPVFLVGVAVETLRDRSASG